MPKRARCALTLMGLLGSLAVDASPLPAHPFVSTGGKARQWLAPDLAEMQFETGAQQGDSATAAASNYTIPSAIPFAQAVNTIFRLQ
ncbi:hypothetical protein [Pseudoduganella violacea]|uniref:Uncharacterized protein YggE n=1 Tax=Pseudoduganella violacea TaxID=1715466 RepID=A0A7W5BCH6_9BURK|nr:hypothetical protein [Pseudoduganella violacea]MBB3120295.1 uncharacterized protein YggE [Pseudoduganella violacea]